MGARLAVGCVIALVALGVAPTAGDSTRRSGGIRTCADQSSAGFPHAFTSRSNLVVGPFALIGAGRLTDAVTVRNFGGNKFPAIVAAGHRVTVRVPGVLRGKVSLYYGDEGPDGERTLADGYAAVTFRACGRRRAASHADGKPVTFWSGFVFTDAPRCVHVRVWLDDEAAPRIRRIPLGRRC